MSIGSQPLLLQSAEQFRYSATAAYAGNGEGKERDGVDSLAFNRPRNKPLSTWGHCLTWQLACPVMTSLGVVPVQIDLVPSRISKIQ